MAETATTGNAFLDTLLERTPPAANQPKRGQNYNFPERLFLKPDGSVVRLQGDPINLAYYQAKGYHLLSDQATRGHAKSEIDQYLEDEYPHILEQQKEKASIINSIRRAVSQDRNLNIDEQGWDEMTLEEMREELVRIRADTGRNIIPPKPRRTAPKPAAPDRMLAGVETTDDTSIEAVEARRRRGG